MAGLGRTGAGMAAVALLSSAATLSGAAPAAAHTSLTAAPSPLDWLTAWSFDPLPWLGAMGAAVAYLLCVLYVNRRHPGTPVARWRVAAFLFGLGTILIALESPVDTFADQLLAVHMQQHLLLAMVAPPLLALGAPGTLLLRASRPDLRRRVLLPLLHARPVRVLTAASVTWLAFTAAMWLTHFTPLYEAALESPSVHEAEHAIFLVTGLLFWWPVVGADPIPGRPSWAVRLVSVALQMPVNAAVGLVIYFAPATLYLHYAALDRAWGPDPRTDQQIAGILMWGVGDVLLLVTFVALVAAWMRAELRRQSRVAQLTTTR